MEHLPKSYNGVQDDPSAAHYAAWRSIIYHFVASYVSKARMADGLPPLQVFQVTDAIIGRTEVYLKLKQYPDDIEFWVGGETRGMYCMCRRPDGGFQVAGDKLILIGSERPQLPVDSVVEAMASSFDSLAISDLRARLTSPRDDVLHEKLL